MNSFKFNLSSLIFLISIISFWVIEAQASINSVNFVSMKERIVSLERIANEQAELLQNLQQKIDDAQSDINSLRGQIQESSHHLDEVIERQKQIYKYIDNLRKSNPDRMNVSNIEEADSSSSIISAEKDRGNKDYNNAIDLVLKKKQYDKAIELFKIFLKKHPDSIYQPNALYWLGQLNYNKGKKDDAVYYFASGLKKFPKSSKSSESLYKLGIIMQDQGENDKAKAAYLQILKEYPNDETAKLAKKRIANLIGLHNSIE